MQNAYVHFWREKHLKPESMHRKALGQNKANLEALWELRKRADPRSNVGRGGHPLFAVGEGNPPLTPRSLMRSRDKREPKACGKVVCCCRSGPRLTHDYWQLAVVFASILRLQLQRSTIMQSCGPVTEAMLENGGRQIFGKIWKL